MTLKISDLASPSVTAWIVALATVGALAFFPSRPSSDDARVARPPIADVNVAAPAMRPTPSEGVDDLIHLDDVRGEDDRYGYPYPSRGAPES